MYECKYESECIYECMQIVLKSHTILFANYLTAIQRNAFLLEIQTI